MFMIYMLHVTCTIYMSLKVPLWSINHDSFWIEAELSFTIDDDDFY